jgi:hypothetical protein
VVIAGVVMLVVSFRHGGSPPAPGAISAAEARREAGAARRTSTGPVLPRSEPTRLDIPRIGVHTAMLSLGLAPDGSAAVPSLSQARLASWYDQGPSPGELGPSVLLGHVDTKSGPAVFYSIGSLHRGDIVEVTRRDGKIAVFGVDEVQRFAKSDFPTDLVYGDLDYSGLRLVTCGGAFDEAKHSYVDNTIVFAHLLGSRDTP